MDLTALEWFAAAAEAGSFSAAAERLYVSHSSISRRMSALERELGVRLFERDCRGSRLTDAGEELLSGGKELLRRSRELRARVIEKGDRL